MEKRSGLEAVCELIERGERFAITGHVNPDGDSVASQLALARILHGLGKSAVLVNRDPMPERLAFLPDAERFETGTRLPDGVDTWLVLDCARFERVGLAMPDAGVTVADIDHHPHNERFGHLDWVDESAPATSFMVLSLAKRFGVTVDAGLATLLFTGIMSDTGYFRFSNATAETFAAASELIAAGAPHVELHRRIFDERPIEEMRVMGHALADLKTTHDRRIAWIEITPRTLDEARARTAPTGLVASSLCSIEGVDVGLSLQARESGETLVEIRSRGAVDVGSVAKSLGGGGHRNASGCTLSVGLDRARELVIDRLRRAVEAVN